MNKPVKFFIVLACLGVLGAALYVPYDYMKKGRRYVDGPVITVVDPAGYWWLWERPPREFWKEIKRYKWEKEKESGEVCRYDQAEVDWSRIFLEMLAVLGLAGAGVVIAWEKKSPSS